MWALRVKRYGGLRRVMITVREDGLLDVVRERETTGESIRGLANLDEAFDAIRAGATEWTGQVRCNVQRPGAAAKGE
jgi:hypothetical protein